MTTSKPAIVFVTGASSGFGAAVARRFAADGARVIAAARRTDRLQDLKDEFGGQILPMQLDVRDRASVAARVAGLPEEFKAIDLLVNNAGLGMRTVNPRFMTEPRGFWTVPPAGFRDVIATNLTGYFLIAREITPRMLDAGGGRIVNISMNHATMTRAGFVP